MSTSNRVIARKPAIKDKGIRLRYQSPSKSLNLCDGPTLIRPDEQLIRALPVFDQWEDKVGLFGAENKFIQYNFHNKLVAKECYADDDQGYLCLYYNAAAKEKDAGYQGLEAFGEDIPILNSYEQAVYSADGIPDYSPEKTLISVELINHGTDNMFNDDWLDMRIYAKDRLEHPYPKMYVPIGEMFYVGFHARNTRNLPYNVEVQIAAEILPPSRVKDKRLIRRTLEFGDQY